MINRPANKLLIIGWDAADWIIIDRLFAQGKLPNLRRLVDGGVRADLSTLDPKLSPLLWSSIATGKTADKHGILNFVEPNPAGDGLRISASTTRRTKALWNIITQSHMKVNAVSWYASHPAEAIAGVCVTNLFQEGEPTAAGAPWPMQSGTVHPQSWEEKLAPQRTAAKDISKAQLLSMIPRLNEIKPKDNHPHTLAKQLARMSSVHNAAVSILKNSPQWDCTMVFYETIDTIGHHFMQFLPPQMPHVSKDQLRLYGDVMLKVYEHHDHALGELLQHAGPDTTVLLLSDHGFHSGDQRPVITQTNPDDRAAVESSWHRSFGVLVMSGAGIKRGEKISAATLLDITPTALALLGLPVGADMDGRVLAEAFAQPYALHVIESWDTKAGEAGMHSDDLRNNPFESQDALNQLIDLGYMPALGDDMKARLDLVRRESDFNLAVVYMSTGRAQLAEPLFAELSRQKPDESRFTTNLANCQFSARNFAACAQTVTAYLLKHPTNAEARLLLVGALANLGKTDEAKTMLARLESDTGDRPELAMSLGDMHGILGQWNDAARLYRRSEKHDPRNPRVQVALARVSLATAKWDDALELSLNALEIQQITPEAHHALGIALAWLGDYPHAIQSFDNALHLQSGLIQAHRFMVILSELVGNQAKAQKHRNSVEQLLATLKTIDGSIHQPPAESWGPQAWAKSIGRTTEM